MTKQDTEIKTVRAVERAIDVLMCFTRERPTLSVTDLQRALSLSRPTLYRLLHTLEGKGLVRSFGEPQRFQLGHGAIALGDAALARIDLVRIAQPHLRRLWDATDETVALLVPAADGLKLCVEEIPSRQALVFTRGAGFTEPMTVGASGKVMLAFMADRGVDGGEPLRAELERIRRDGYCISTGEIIGGAIAIAAPVFDRDGHIAGAICVFGPEARFSDVHRQNCVDEACTAARNVSHAMGFHGDKGGALLGAAE